MKLKSLFLLCFALLAKCLVAQNIPNRPSPARTVNDLVGVMSSGETQQLEQKLKSYMDSTSTQIVVVTVKSVGDYAMEEVALKILRDWGVGQKGKDNGIVLLCAIEDRKIYISTGYGMEGVLPDMICKRIIDQDIKPAFRQKAYYQGFDDATTSIIQAARGEYQGDDSNQNAGGGDGLFIILMVLFILFIIYRANRNGNTMVSRRGHSPWNNSGGGWINTGGGYYDNRRNDNDNDNWGGGGGFDFGGGSGGGGGAGGDW